MPDICAAYGCNSVRVKGCGISFFGFPKDLAKKKIWHHYCRRKFELKHHHKLCSKHFTKVMFDRDPEMLASLGYENAVNRLKVDAVPDIPLIVDKTVSDSILKQQQQCAIATPCTSRNAFVKRQRKRCLDEMMSKGEQEKENADPADEVEMVDVYNSECDVEQGPTDEVTLEEIAEHSSVKCVSTQMGKPFVNILPNRTRVRRIQVNPKTRTVATQCELIKDMPVTKPVSKPVAKSFEEEMYSDSSDEEIKTFTGDSDFEVESDLDSEDSDIAFSVEESSSCPLVDNVGPKEEKQFLVSESALCLLLNRCHCGEQRQTKIQHSQGMMIATLSVCPSGHTVEWKSQSTHNSLPWGNLMTAAAIFYSGSNSAKVLQLFKILKLQTFSPSTFFRIQKAYIVPSVVEVWEFEKERNIEERKGRQLTLGGDARCDSPGYSAKYGSYSLMDLENQTVLDIQLIQSNEVKGSTHMELEGLKRGLQTLKDSHDVNVGSLITDRHVMVKKFMKDQEAGITHYFDVWHMAKGVSKKLEGLSKKKGAETIKPWIKGVANHLYWTASTSGDDSEMKKAKWDSLTRHISNNHVHHSEKFPECAHGPLEDREWMQEGSRPYKLLCGVVNSPYLLRDIGKLSPLYQTYGLEVYHNIVNHFAPKSTHFFFKSMLARLYVAGLHFNENSQKKAATTAEGTPRWQIAYPKSKKGLEAVVKPVKINPTFSYVGLLINNLVQRRTDLPSYKVATEAQIGSLFVPPPTTSGFTPANKEELIQRHKSRFPLQSNNQCTKH